MKQISLIIFLFFSCFGLAQKKITLDEVIISSNYTDANFLTDFKPEFGVGFGLHHVFRKDKNMNFIVGIDYNNINYSEANFFIPSTNHIYKNTDISINLHSIIFPILFRFKIGKRFFFNEGLLINSAIIKYENGTRHYFGTYDTINYREVSSGVLPTLGTTLGLGINYSLFNQQIFTAFNYAFYFTGAYNYTYSKSVSYFKLNLGIKLKS